MIFTLIVLALLLAALFVGGIRDLWLVVISCAGSLLALLLWTATHGGHL